MHSVLEVFVQPSIRERLTMEIRWHPLQSMRYAGSKLMYYILVFENLRHRPSTRKQVTRVFKKLHSGERF